MSVYQIDRKRELRKTKWRSSWVPVLRICEVCMRPNVERCLDVSIAPKRWKTPRIEDLCGMLEAKC